ncbi:IclR family transcriptional regulator [Roseomonas sp. BN140053]|uniref:IclR family transcriptional regulator n=1 Tax=Roseomonas sp. BN140053 TaxID=3391898 RepID=UPI0039E811A9
MPRTKPLPAEDAADRRSIQSITVGFALIRTLEASARPMPLKDLAAASGMTPGRAHAYLASFRALGLVRQAGEGERYELGPYALALGLAALRRLDVREAAEAPMQRFHTAIGEGIYLSVWSGQAPVIVSRLDGAHSLPFSIRVGHALPLESSATGRVFLAFLPEARRQLASQRVATAPATLEALLEEVRRCRFGRADSLIHAGFNALSAPILDHENRLAGALTALGPAGELDIALGGTAAAALAEAAGAISAALGSSAAPSAGTRAGSLAPAASGD